MAILLISVSKRRAGDRREKRAFDRRDRGRGESLIILAWVTA